MKFVVYQLMCTWQSTKRFHSRHYPLFSDYQCRPPFYLLRQWPRLQLAGPGYPDQDTYAVEIYGTSFGQSRGPHPLPIIRRTVSRRLRVKVQPCNRGKATASHQPVTSVSLAIQPSSACLYIPLGTGQRACTCLGFSSMSMEHAWSFQNSKQLFTYVTLYPAAGMLHSR